MSKRLFRYTHKPVIFIKSDEPHIPSVSWWYKLPVILNLFMVVATFILAFCAYRTFTKQRDYYINTTRPFVGISNVLTVKDEKSSVSISSVLTFKDEKPNVSYIVKNYGNLPAINIHGMRKIFLSDDSLFVIESFHPKEAFFSLFPGESNTIKAKQYFYPGIKIQFLNICFFYMDNDGNKYWTTRVEAFFFDDKGNSKKNSTVKTYNSDSPPSITIVRKSP